MQGIPRLTYFRFGVSTTSGLVVVFSRRLLSLSVQAPEYRRGRTVIMRVKLRQIGADLSFERSCMEIICRACNRSNQPGSLRCSNCGKRLLDENKIESIPDTGTVGSEPEVAALNSRRNRSLASGLGAIGVLVIAVIWATASKSSEDPQTPHMQVEADFASAPFTAVGNCFYSLLVEQYDFNHNVTSRQGILTESQINHLQPGDGQPSGYHFFI